MIGKRLIKRQIISQIDKQNLNGDTIPRAVMQSAIDKLEHGEVFGQLGMKHNEGVCDLSKVSHIVKNFTIDDDDLVRADIQVIETPMGKHLSKFLETDFVKHVAFRISADNVVATDTEVSSMRLTGVHCIPKAEDALELE